MKKKFELFWKDYCDLYTVSLEFLKKHWIGTIIYAVILITVEMIWVCYSIYGSLGIIVDWFDEAFEKTEQFFKRKVHKA